MGLSSWALQHPATQAGSSRGMKPPRGTATGPPSSAPLDARGSAIVYKQHPGSERQRLTSVVRALDRCRQVRQRGRSHETVPRSAIHGDAVMALALRAAAIEALTLTADWRKVVIW